MIGRVKVFLGGELVHEGSNIILYSSADVIAQLAAGNHEYTPRHVGFVYGDDATAPFPASLSDPASDPQGRDQPWAHIKEQVAAAERANVAVAPLALRPSIVLPPSGPYTGNTVAYYGSSSDVMEYAFSTEGSDFAGTIEDTNDVKFYQAILLSRILKGGTTTYVPFARFALGDAAVESPVGKGLGVQWSVTFN